MSATIGLRSSPARRTLWGPLVIGVAVVALWNTPLVYPLKVLTVMLHEMCHAVATLATGGWVEEIRTQWDESGHTLSRGGCAWIIYPAGYLGTAMLGALAISIRRPMAQRVFMIALGAAYALLHAMYGNWRALDFWVGVGTGAFLFALSFAAEWLCDAAFNLLGIVLCLYTAHDVTSDLLGSQVAQSDAGLLARHWHAAWLARPIGVVWVLMCLGLLAWAIVRRWRGVTPSVQSGVS
jgi:hypothetical protein